MVTDKLKHQGLRSIFENQAQLKTNPNLEPIITKFAQPKTFVHMRLTDVLLGFGDALADLSPLRLRKGANFAQETKLDSYGFQVRRLASNRPLNDTYFFLARWESTRFLNFSHSSGLTPYS